MVVGIIPSMIALLFCCILKSMTPKQIEALLNKLLSAANEGNREAATAYHELSIAFNSWQKRRSADNWNDVIRQAQGAMMWVQKDK